MSQPAALETALVLAWEGKEQAQVGMPLESWPDCQVAT